MISTGSFKNPCFHRLAERQWWMHKDFSHLFLKYLVQTCYSQQVCEEYILNDKPKAIIGCQIWKSMEAMVDRNLHSCDTRFTSSIQCIESIVKNPKIKCQSNSYSSWELCRSFAGETRFHLKVNQTIDGLKGLNGFGEKSFCRIWTQLKVRTVPRFSYFIHLFCE